MSYQRTKTVSFGASRSGLATVAWSLDGSTWSTVGVSESPAGSGIYQASITFADTFAGVLSWKTGEASGQRFAAEDISPPASGVPTAIFDETIGGGTFRQAVHAMAATLTGNVTPDGEGNTFADFMDPDTPRVRSTSTLTERTVIIEA